MDKVYPLIEMGATYIENLIILMAVITISGQKFKGMRHVLFPAFFSLISSVIVIGMNEISVFSFLTPMITMSFVIFVASKIASTGSLVVRITACMLAFLVIQTIDYILVVLVGFVYGVPHDMFVEFTTIGPKRSVYLLIDKLTDVLLYLFIRDHIKGLKVLSTKLQMVLCSLSIVAYAVMQLLFSMVIKPDLMTMQIAVIFSWLFVLCLIAVVFSLFSVMTKAEKDPLSDERYIRNKRISRVLAFTEMIVILAIYAIIRNIYFLSIASTSMFAVSFMMLIPKICQARRSTL